jgi:predicted dehydrogenase
VGICTRALAWSAPPPRPPGKSWVQKAFAKRGQSDMHDVRDALRNRWHVSPARTGGATGCRSASQITMNADSTTAPPAAPLPRRAFIRNTALALGATVIASRPAGFAAPSAPNSRLGVAWVGCGDRARALLKSCLENRAAWNLEFPAVCDVWSVNREAMAKTIQEATGRRPRLFSRHEDLLALPEVDAVVIATPDSSHSPILVDVARARKHVYVEKPMATRIEDANAAVDAVEKNGIVCQVGTQFRSMGNFIGAARLMESGVLGTLIKVHASYNRSVGSWARDFKNVHARDVDWEQFRLGLHAAPFDPRQFRCWQLYRDYSVGLSGLLGVHVIDIGSWLAGDPLPRSAVGMSAHIVWKDRELPDTQECLYHYPKNFLLQFTSRLGNGNPAPEIVFYGANGTLRCPFSATPSFTATGEGGGVHKLKQPVSSTPVSSPSHLENWFDCIRAGNRKTNADVHAGYAHSVASIIGSQACDTGRRVTFDPRARSVSA